MKKHQKQFSVRAFWQPKGCQTGLKYTKNLVPPDFHTDSHQTTSSSTVFSSQHVTVLLPLLLPYNSCIVDPVFLLLFGSSGWVHLCCCCCCWALWCISQCLVKPTKQNRATIFNLYRLQKIGHFDKANMTELVVSLCRPCHWNGCASSSSYNSKTCV